MRYTTCIDITEIPSVWRNINTSRLYFFMCLKCGYHDEDRDKIEISLRVLAGQSGLTLSAVRNALTQLEKAGLITKEGNSYRVKKWVASETITARKQATTAKEKSDDNDLARKREEQVQEYQRQVLAAVQACSDEELETWIEELNQGRSLRHHRTSINPNKNNIQWLQKCLEARQKKASR